MPTAPVPHVLARLPGESVDYALHASLESEEMPQVSQSGPDRLRGPENYRTDSNVEQGESACGRGERAVQDVRDSPEGLPSSAIFLRLFWVLVAIRVNNAAQDKD
eukprot:7120473-Alexandrium_andersonii.AAC.1